jgi:hypothetical protein
MLHRTGNRLRGCCVLAVLNAVQGATRVDERFMQHMANLFGQGTFDRWRNNPANAADVQDLIYDEWETCKCSFVGGGAAGATCSAVALQISVNLPYTLFGTAAGSDRLVGVSSASLVHT